MGLLARPQGRLVLLPLLHVPLLENVARPAAGAVSHQADGLGCMGSPGNSPSLAPWVGGSTFRLQQYIFFVLIISQLFMACYQLSFLSITA